MPSPRLLTAGEAFEDLVFVGLERLPSPGTEVKTDTFHATFGGGAVITAVAAARLGISTAILSALSGAAASRLKREHVAVTNLRRSGEPHAVTAALSTASDRSFVTFTGVNAVLEPRLLRTLGKVTATHVHIALRPGSAAAWAQLVTRLRRRGITVSGDFGWNESLADDSGLPGLLHALDLVFLNELEAPLYARATSLADAYPRLRTSRSNVVVKLGRRGSRWVRAEGDIVMKSTAMKAVDTTGAGDAFNAGFLAAWLRGATPEMCLKTGNAVGGASTRKAGGLDGLPGKRELPRLLRAGRAAPPRQQSRSRRAS